MGDTHIICELLGIGLKATGVSAMLSPSGLSSPDHIIVCDGAMGTMLHARGIPLGQSFDELNLSRPDIVEEVHLAYVDAGAEIIETNTFGANRLKLESHGLKHRVAEINMAGARIARKCAEGRALVAGSVGPTGRLMLPFGQLDSDQAYDVYREQITALCEGGIDLLIIETMQDLREAKAALFAARDVADIPVICQMSFVQEGRTMMGTPPEVAAVVLSGLGVTLVGTNCGTGPQDMLTVVQAMSSVCGTGLTAQPNAGLPRFYEGRLMYLSTPEYVADFAMQFVEAGAVLVGGCCGTTPDHTRAIVRAVRSMSPPRRPSDNVVRLAGRTDVIRLGGGCPVVINDRMLNRQADLGSREASATQSEAIAPVLAVNFDTADDPSALVQQTQESSPSALCLVGSKPESLERALRPVEGRSLVVLYAGAPLDRCLPIVRQYGAAVAATLTGATPDELVASGRAFMAMAEQTGLGISNILANIGILDEHSIEAIRAIRTGLRLPVVGSVGVESLHLLGRALDAGLDAVMADPRCPQIQDILSDRTKQE